MTNQPDHPKQSAIAANWAERGFDCSLQCDPPGQRFEGYVHEMDELLILLSGDLETEIDGVVARPAVGQECFIPAGALHSVRNVGGSEACWLYGYRRRE